MDYALTAEALSRLVLADGYAQYAVEVIVLLLRHAPVNHILQFR
jgi:hypothetical protein